MFDFIGKAFDKVLGIVNKTTLDQDKKEELEIALKELQITTDLEMQKIMNERATTPLGKCISVTFPVIAFVFSLTLFANIFIHIFKFWNGETTELIPVSKEMYQVIMIYLTGYFSSSTVGKWKGGDK